MTIPEIDPTLAAQNTEEERKRRKLLALLLLLLLVLCCVGYFFISYLLKPRPITDMLPEPVQVLSLPPTYKSFFPADKPVGVAISPDGQRIYVAEGGGQRLIKMFDRDGNFIKSFAPPGTSNTNRKILYIAVAPDGRVFANDTYNNVIAVFDADGIFLDGIIARDVTLTEIVAGKNNGVIPQGTLYYYSNISKTVDYKIPGKDTVKEPAPSQTAWSPLGIRFDQKGNLLITNIVGGKHEVMIFPAADINGDWLDFDPQTKEFGVEGKEAGQLSFPNSVVTDSLGNFYVADGNNARISAWTVDLRYKNFFAFGTTEDALNLPRGMWMDEKNRLHVADAIGQYIRVYDVSGDEPVFLYNFGVYGTLDGEFNYPSDICIDTGGRLYIADRENNRVQIWSY